MIDFKNILDNLGFKLSDHGRYWQTAAIFRDGDNPTAIQIYKDTGVWRDYVEGEGYLPFELLVKRTVADSDEILKSIYEGSKDFSIRTKPTERLEEEKTYDVRCLKRLLPNRQFFLDRGISDATLDEYKGGYATTGTMYGRFVFPIFRDDGVIHGFSGRWVKNKETSVKWLHNGKTRNWMYPLHTIGGVLEAIEEKGFIILVESIGDSLALTNAGFRNHFVVFGLNINAKLLSILSSFSCPIHLCFNNDILAKQNRGTNNAVKHVLNLASQVSFERLFLSPPPKNDFGDMDMRHIQEFCNGFSSQDHKGNCYRVIALAGDLLKEIGKQTRGYTSLSKSLKQFRKQVDFTYG
jgi:hypothetical protein